MDNLKELFELFDTDNDGFLDIMSLKRLINLIDIPLEKIDQNKNKFNYSDFIDVIIQNKNINKIDKNILKEKLEKDCLCHDKDFIIKNLYSTKGKYIETTKLESFSSNFLDE